MKKWWKELIDKPLLKAFLHYYQASDSELTSVAVAYYWLISIFPLLLVVVNILPYFQIPVGEFLGFMKDVLPPSLYEGVEKIAREVLTQPSTGLLSFSVLSALWSRKESWTYFPSDAKSPSQFWLAAPLCVCLVFDLIWSDDFGFTCSLLDKRWHYLSGFTRVGRSSDLCPPLCYLGHALLFSSQSI